MTERALLTIKGLNLSPYPNFDVSIEALSLPAGFYHLLGANGAGKSTLLGCIAGLYPSTFSNLSLEQDAYNLLSLQQLAGRRAYLTQQNQAHYSVTGYETLAICFDTSATELKTKLVEHPVILGLEVSELLAKPLQYLSGGERQRCYLSAALLGCDKYLMPHSKLLLLDEPFNGLDIKHTLWLIRYLETISREICVIASHHEVNFALKSKNPCLLMKKGVFIGVFKHAKEIEKTHLVHCFELNEADISYENDAYYQISWNLDQLS